MTPMEAWSIVSANLAHLVRLRRCQGDPKGFTDAESEAEVITFKALQEMQERMYPRPLTVVKLMEMQDQPVWVEWQDAPELSGWGVVESVYTVGKTTYLYLWGRMGKIDIDNTVSVSKNPVRVYRFKPAEVKKDG